MARVGGLSIDERASCAHGRRLGSERDLVVWGEPGQSGRFPRAIPIGEYRERAYRVRPELLEIWGGLTVRNGYIQRSAQPPFFNDPERFLAWLREQPASGRLLEVK